jgi:acetyl-CoA C-acetyltransferase
MPMKTVYVVDGVRTAIASFQGALAGVPAAKLGAAAIKGLVERCKIPGDQVDEVLMGNVLLGGQGQAPARQACIYSGLPQSVPCVTLAKVCGSGLRTVMMGSASIKSGDVGLIISGGMENMTLTPYALPKARAGFRMGNGEIVDLMVNDGLWDVYNNFHMGMAAEKCAAEMSISRKEQDDFAIASYTKAIKSIETGLFKKEIVPVEVAGAKGATALFEQDEEPFRSKLDKIPSLKAAFKKDGTVTAANASSINDGAAAVLLASEEKVKALGLAPKFRVVGYAGHAQAPEWFTTAPAYAIKKVWEKTGLTDKDIDLYEINEAFSVVSLAVNRLCELDPAKVNVRGGAVALGHPIGASGTRILVTLMHTMEDVGAKRGLASLCIGGGEAVALIIERV